MSLTIHYFQYGHTACLIGDLPKTWPAEHKFTNVEAEVNCPSCLEGLKYGESTYELLEEGTAMRCRRCWHLTRDPEEVLHRYCARCNARHDDIWPPARLFWLKSYAIPS